MEQKLIKNRSNQPLRLPQLLRTLIALVLREMSTTYGRSPGGYIWAVAEPVAGITLLTLLFSLGFQAPPIGSSFALFYATGLVPFLVYADLNAKLSQAINFSKPLLSYPRVTLVDAILARAFLNTLTQTLVFCVVFLGLLSLLDTHTSVDPLHLGVSLGLAVMLGIGVGTLNCFLTTLFPMWQRIWSVINRPTFLLSCVVFTFETIPPPYNDMLWWNPLVHIVGITRQAIFFGYDGGYISVLYVMFFSAMAAVLGLFLIWRFRNALLNT